MQRGYILYDENREKEKFDRPARRLIADAYIYIRIRSLSLSHGTNYEIKRGSDSDFFARK